ncbi:uncharacterized protein PAC_08506 [Phialocephala subalpina]|uniref:Zn(2)-C6 fungal-type domain-containing protein n=1 Tax=Phialocephala subalpina TaxID=576137 RepID=A0A1L7X0R0_9HELO|nr:uncharacterized protein PAC_08506 [Phialocephala subalpina]
MNVDGNGMMDFSAITDFLADAGTPSEEHEENQQQGPQAATPPKDQTSGGRIIRRRARKACVECHKRKVRCDVLTRGQVCTNCRLDGLPCRLPAKDGRRRTQIVHPQPTTNADLPVSQLAAPAPVVTTTAPDDPVPTESQFLPIRDEASSFCNAWSFRPSSTSELANTRPSQQSSSHIDVIFSYYGFLESEPLSHIPPEDFKFLENKGCFHVPSRPVLDEFIKEYFLHVHPVLPILDERMFWEMYLCGGRIGAPSTMRLSLFLFRAILFFVSEEVLKRMGFRDAFEARISFYRRAKLLFDFDTTSDPMSIAQGAVLLTYYSSDREPLANTSWLRIAIQYAQQERAHLYSQTSNLSSSDRQTRKRLWWCCILRDRILPLGVRRSIQITHNTFSFHSSSPLTSSDLDSELSHSKVYDYDTKRVLNRILEKQVELAIILTDVLELTYPVGQLDYNCLMKMPSRISVVRGRLEGWMSGLHVAFDASQHGLHKSVTLFLGLTEIYYHSAQAALCQYESLSLQAGASIPPSTTNPFPITTSSRNKELGTHLHSSIASISKTVGELVQLDVARYLPVSAVAYMALPIILNSIDLQNSKVEKGGAEGRGELGKVQAKRHQLRLYNEAMSLCHARYTGTGLCLKYIDQTIASARSDLGNSKIEGGEERLSSKELMKVTEGRNRMDDWFEAFVSKPRQYLRIAMTVDVWLSVGKYAASEDLPRVLMLDDGDGSSNNLGVPRSFVDLDEQRLLEESGGVIRELVSEPRRILVESEKRRRDLDYFDFGSSDIGKEVGVNVDVIDFEAGMGGESEVGSNEYEIGSSEEGDEQSMDQEVDDWNGQMVEGILEDVLRIGSF